MSGAAFARVGVCCCCFFFFYSARDHSRSRKTCSRANVESGNNYQCVCVRAWVRARVPVSVAVFVCFHACPNEGVIV